MISGHGQESAESMLALLCQLLHVDAAMLQGLGRSEKLWPDGSWPGQLQR